MVAKSGIEPVNGVFAVVFKIKSASNANESAVPTRGTAVSARALAFL